MSAALESSDLRAIRNILHRAAAGAPRAFGDLGAIWELPLPSLLTAHLAGMPLIAPAPSSCCGSSASRSAGSALVRGLRGEPPFDGARFPRLPWGGAPLDDAAIEEIAGWIDDGCPGERIGEPDDAALAGHAAPEVEIRALEPRARDVFESGDDAAARGGDIRQRVNIDCMTAAQLEKFRYALREMFKLNKWPNDARSYNNLALIHQNHCQHGWERFLPWHRAYIYEFEQALQDHCPDVTVPYWDFTMPAYRPEQPDRGIVIPYATQAFLTDESLVFLGGHRIDAERLRPLVGRCFATFSAFSEEVAGLLGAALSETQRQRCIDALLAANPLWYPLRYPGQFGTRAKPRTINESTFHYHYPRPEDIAQIMGLRSFRDFGGGSLYDDSYGFLDQNPHNAMHVWTGGVNPDHHAAGAAVSGMIGVKVAGRKFHQREDLYSSPEWGDMTSNLTASYDPIFWPIHANIDRIWAEWQQLRPDAVPAGLDAVLTPWAHTVRETLDVARFGYEYVKSTRVVPVGLSAPVARFVSGPLPVHAAVREAFGRAELRLHRVPQLPRSCFVRAFLNEPAADASTPLDHPGYAGYLAIFGHGPCYGGPGHCDIPPLQNRAFDRRPRSHNTPRNHRIDITRAARRLIEEGAVELTVSLVVIGADYREDRELLRLDRVSLTFFD